MERLGQCHGDTVRTAVRSSPPASLISSVWDMDRVKDGRRHVHETLKLLKDTSPSWLAAGNTLHRAAPALTYIARSMDNSVDRGTLLLYNSWNNVGVNLDWLTGKQSSSEASDKNLESFMKACFVNALPAKLCAFRTLSKHAEPSLRIYTDGDGSEWKVDVGASIMANVLVSEGDRSTINKAWTATMPGGIAAPSPRRSDRLLTIDRRMILEAMAPALSPMMASRQFRAESGGNFLLHDGHDGIECSVHGQGIRPLQFSMAMPTYVINDLADPKGLSVLQMEDDGASSEAHA